MDEGEGEGGGGMLGKKRTIGAGEVDYKNKSGTAWSHSYLNQKPWHPLSYPNQRRKWIAEQTDAQRQRRAEEVAREFAQEQEFFRQTSLISKKEKEKMEMMKAVSFMYVRPPGYNAESAKAAEIDDERKTSEQTDSTPSQPQQSTLQDLPLPGREKKKARPKDVFGRALPTEEEFEVLKNAPRLETGMPARAKPFGVEVRNVKCARCGAFGHQSGDRECPLKDAIMPNEESRLKRDDPLTSILAHTDPGEPLKWELKQKPGMSPPRGGFKPDDPNQQIVAEDIFDEYGGFLSGGGLPDLLTSFSLKKSRKHSRRKSKKKVQLLSPSDSDATDREKKSKKEKVKGEKHTKQKHSYASDSPDFKRHSSESRRRISILGSSEISYKIQLSSPSDTDTDREKLKKVKGKSVKHMKRKHLDLPDSPDMNRHHESRSSHFNLNSSYKSHKYQFSDSDSDADREKRPKKEKIKKEKRRKRKHTDSSDNSDVNKHCEDKRPVSYRSSPDNSDSDRSYGSSKHRRHHHHKYHHHHNHS